MHRQIGWLTAATLLALLGMTALPAAEETKSPLRYTFSWPVAGEDGLAPRGGTTRGPEVELDTEANAAWKALQEPGLSDFERDRRAILAMAGGYRVTFDFLEIADFRSIPKRERPYQSWGTERVYVAEDRGDFISLQHLLVMRIIDKEGKVSEPFVTKHWRQDWSYQDRTMVEYRGRETWERRLIAKGDSRGKWTQSVYQVDDSPRYESIGRWNHATGASTWISAETWRPLPRREWSVRKDYDVLVGTNRHTVIQGGWIQEENNLKGVTESPGVLRAAHPYLGREYGVARYQRIRNYDFTAGDQYFERTRAFWADVRTAWDDRFAATERISLTAPVDQSQLFLPLFQQADAIAEEQALTPEDQAALIRKTLSGMIKPETNEASRR